VSCNIPLWILSLEFQDSLVETLKLLRASFELSHFMVVADEKDLISAVLKQWCDISDPCDPPDIIFTSGGTGFSPRDVTPEATKEILEKEAPALSTAITVGSLKIINTAMLSRAVSGIRKNT